jgi:hypothetical protein
VPVSERAKADFAPWPVLPDPPLPTAAVVLPLDELSLPLLDDSEPAVEVTASWPVSPLM